MKSTTTNKNKFLEISMITFRALTKARDVYVKGMMSYGDRMGGVSMIATTGLCAVPRSDLSPKSYGCDFDKEMKELVWAASAQSPRTVPSKTTGIAMESIDEDKPCLAF